MVNSKTQTRCGLCYFRNLYNNSWIKLLRYQTNLRAPNNNN